MKKLLPCYCVDKVCRMDEKFLKENSVQAIIFDIDNTLVAHTVPIPPQDVLEYFEFLKKLGIKYAIVSNNSKERVAKFCHGLDVPHYWRALKPRKKFLKKAVSDMGTCAKNTLLVGDQLFTDILGGNRMGMTTVLVTALGEDETGFVSFKRKFEKRILKKNSGKIKCYNPDAGK